MPEFVEIDGGAGEGGGQLLRTVLALSALTKKPVKISKIRAGREMPGLKPQHLASIKTIAEICNAEVGGAWPRSMAIEFSPREIKSVNFSVNIATAGAISLLLQQVLPVAMLQPAKLRVEGGTNVAFSPPMEFLRQALFPELRKMGARFEAHVTKKGFFPKGRGIVSFSSRKAKLPLLPVAITALGELEFIEVFSCSASLPPSVSRNQAIGAKHALKHLGAEFTEFIESAENSSSIGSSASVFAHYSSGAVLCGSALGAKGKPGDHVGREAGQNLLAEMSSGQPCDSHLSDQLIPFMALAKGKSEIHCTRLTQHCLTNIDIVRRFLPVQFNVEGSLGAPAKISVDGAAFRP